VRSGSDRRRARAALLAIAAVAALIAPATASAHPSHLVEPIEVGDFGYAPADVTILQGRTVQWRWENAVAHSVTSQPGSPQAFDSGLHSDGDSSFVRRFDVPGTYTYASTGSSRIEGVLRVLPYPGEDPAIDDLRVKAGGKKPKVRFELNKKLDVVVRVQERTGGKWRTEQALSRRLEAGANRVKLKPLAPGPYRAEVTAYDRYRRTDVARERFRVPR
jgi:plastocyanin